MIKHLRALVQWIRQVLFPKFTPYRAKWPYIVTVLIALLLVLFGINSFIELTDTLKSDALAAFDDQVTDFVLSYRDAALTRYFTIVTDIGDVNGYLIVLAICILLTVLVLKRWKYMLQIVIVLVLATLSNMMLKRAIDRARPGIEHLVVVKTLSYPSGHAMSAMAFYGFVIYLITHLKIHIIWKTIIICVLATLILSIGLSRIYLGVHFPSDVLGGFIAGLIWVFFCILIFNLLEVFRKDPLT
ncbi:MAG: phosphatase PAP2 family protein [Flavobacteriaceae bacterium]|nr:phosphatase PAP2 family protein [Flavobacteriaceae bacterium]